MGPAKFALAVVTAADSGKQVPSRPPMMVVLTSIGVMAVAAALPTATIWQPLALLLVPAAAAWVVRRRSLLVALSLGNVALAYGVTWLVLGHPRPPGLVSLVVLWSAGLTLGCLLVRPPHAVPVVVRRWRPPTILQIVLAGVLLAIQALLTASAEAGYEAQITSGISTPTGIVGTLAWAGPIIILILFITALSSRQRLVPASLLVAGQLVVLSLSGFRSAASGFLLAGAILTALALPRDSPWRQPRRLLIVGVVIFLLMIITFMVGAQVRNAAAVRVTGQSTLFGLHDAVALIVARLDNGDPLQKAILFKENTNVQAAVSWVDQLAAVVPRFLSPEKPTVDYGRNVSVAVFGAQRSYQTSTSITVVGDTMVNFGVLGVAIGSLLLGYILRISEIWFRAGTGALSLVVVAVLASSILNQSTLILLGIGCLRGFLVTASLWGMTEFFRRHGSAQDTYP